ncbi:MAG: type II toxin-antitoxin system MqsA family antitoxin [Betaproteobacteria bacterium]|nr:type II toxin-antitoxin system MqsA family antitoxin [Betaproteobacteria bacterium]MDE2622923.1 type II toxin-antitoxin system MqsA family antitoxin [Betaproteobacteria bacterium]
MKCLSCHESELIHSTKDMPYEFNGKSFVINQVVGEFCPNCGAIFLSEQEARRVNSEIQLIKSEPSAN